MHSHLQTEGFFYMHHWQRFALAIFFICFVHRQQIPNGKMSLVKVKGTPAPSISKYHQGAFEQRTHRSQTALWPAGEDCGSTGTRV